MASIIVNLSTDADQYALTNAIKLLSGVESVTEAPDAESVITDLKDRIDAIAQTIQQSRSPQTGV